jgi:hypothetical protein
MANSPQSGPEAMAAEKHPAVELQSSFISRHGLFIGLLLIGLVFRLLFMHYQGLSNDELSGWGRTRFNDWQSFWHLGVKAGDMHPVFYQAFLWCWVRIFGDSEFSLRATGLLFYLLNSWLIYRISIRFFNKNAGLLILALYAGLAFTVMNTVFARPYNSGTFFLLLALWAVCEINQLERRISGWHVALVIGLSGAMLSHYFAFLVAGFLGLAALIYVRKERRKDILIAGILSILIFIPHWPVTSFQLGQGGLGWLGAPDWKWLPTFFFALLNKSWVLVAFLAVLAFFSMRKSRYTPLSDEEKLVFWVFATSFMTGYVLSIWYTPILRDLVMLFLLPFLFLVLFRGFKKVKSGPFQVLLLAVPVAIGVHSIFKANLLKPLNFGVFREIGELTNSYSEKLGRDHITYASNFCSIDYLNYYLDAPVSEEITDWAGKETLYKLAERAKKSDKPYFSYSWSNSPQLPMYYEVVRQYFPHIAQHEAYFNSAFTLFSKKPADWAKGGLDVQPFTGNFENTFPVKTSSEEEFTGALKIQVGECRKLLKKGGYLLVTMPLDSVLTHPVDLVATAERDGAMVLDREQPLLYIAYDQSRLTDSLHRQAYLAIQIPDKLKKTDIIHVYLWNPSRKAVHIRKPKLFIVKTAA